MLKWGRAYSLRCYTNTGIDITIQLPFTIEFDIERSDYGTVNFGQISIYNLSEIHRNQLQIDQYTQYQGYYDGIGILYVELQAGYGPGPKWPVIFAGTATRAYSVRRGTDFITTIECHDGGIAYLNAITALPVPANTPMQDIIAAVMNDLVPYGVKVGSIGAFEGAIPKANSYNGSTVHVLRELTNGNFFIDNLVVNALLPNEVLGGPTLTIGPDSGLLNTPLKEQQVVMLEMLFEPRVKIGTQILLAASSQALYNGYHEIVSIHHKGMISLSVAGDCTTSLTVRAGLFEQLIGKAGL